MNFEPAIQNIRSKLNLWKTRALTLIGKVTVVKAHALSQIQFLASSIRTPDWVIQEVEDIVKKFVWSGSKKIAKEKAAKTWKEGGITLPQIEHLCRAASIKMTLRAKELGDSTLWSANYGNEIRKLGGSSAMHPQTDLRLIKEKETPTFLMEQLESWHQLQKLINPKWAREITESSPVCFNRKIDAPKVRQSIRKKTHLDTPYLMKLGLTRVGQWFDSRSERAKWQTVKEKGARDNAFFEWQKVSKALRIAKIRVRSEETLEMREQAQFSPVLYTEKGMISYPDISQKRILSEIAQRTDYKPNGTQVATHGLLEFEEKDLSEAFKRYRFDNPCTRKQEFQFKLLSGTLYSNKEYAKLGRKDSGKCTFCAEEKQNFTHLYISCPKVKAFRADLAKRWTGDPMSDKRWFLGLSHSNEVLEKSKDIIAKEANHYIFKMNWAGKSLSVEAFKNWIKSEEEPEEALACRVNKIFDHHLKWSHIQLLLDI